MNSLCPFFKENCHGNECIMWRNENCLIASFLEHLNEIPQEETNSLEDEVEETIRPSISLHGEETPECLKDVTPEELAIEMIDYWKKEFPEEEGRRGFYTVSRFFWENKGVSRFFASPETQLKMEKANFLAEKEITKQEDEKKRQQLEKEKDELPSLIGQCVDWARMKGLKRLALTDIDAFLFDKEITLLKETKRSLFSNANSTIKSKG